MLRAMSLHGRKLKQVVRQPKWRALAALALVAALLVAALGGFRGTRGKSLPEIGPGAVIRNDALEFTPTRAWISDVQPGRDRPSSYGPPVRYLVLRGRALNRTESSVAGGSALYNTILWLPVVPGAGVKPESVWRADDHDAYFHLPPRLATEVDLIWTVPADQAPEAGGHWGVQAMRFKSKTYLTGGSEWLPAEPLARLVLPLEDRTGGVAR
jgi:hypothetical protein